MKSDHTISNSITYLALITGSLLLIPRIAMWFSDEVVWSLSDFVLAGILIFGTGLTYLLVTRTSTQLVYRFAVGIALFSGLFLIWSNLAVGIIGSEYNPINLWYFGVILVGIIGSLVARFKPNGMAFTMLAMVIAQTTIMVFALIEGMHHNPFSPLMEILGINALFVLLFATSGFLFRYASENSTQDDKNEIHA